MKFILLFFITGWAICNANPITQHATSIQDVTIIDLDQVRNMSMVEYLGKQIDYLLNGTEEEPQSTFVGRCIGIAKKIRQIMPVVMIGAGVIITKLGFLLLFSLKTLGLVGLLLLLNVGTAAAKLGAFLATKKHEHSPQYLHVHVQPTKHGELHDDLHDIYSSHLKGPPYGWEDKIDDQRIQSHQLYNLYEKLKLENDLRKYLTSKSYL
ncbi:hypothetical protein ABEB36_007345 [Hypothenemus hampei]|uniref:Uncharacterized protein n=1 Tax=Hypothenemus hampei TaxID=57062 RepID=A0ABD1ETM6_HYPHA